MERSWQVLLIGGASGSGKSTLSHPLAARSGLPLVEVDDLVVAVQCLTTPEEQPELHHWLTHPATGMSAEQVVDKQIAFAEALRPAISAVIANHLETKTPVIIEGDYVLPDLVGPGVSAVFLHESEEEQLVRNHHRLRAGPRHAGR